MTLDEYKSELKLLESEFEKRKVGLKKEYALSNNPYKPGDIFTDHMGSIIIELIQVSLRDVPCCVYTGIELKKDGTPKKGNPKRQAWQINEAKVPL